jgi:hypothetical protein
MLQAVAQLFLEVERAQRPVTVLRRFCTAESFDRLREIDRQPDATLATIGTVRWNRTGTTIHAVAIIRNGDGTVGALTLALTRYRGRWAFADATSVQAVRS